MAARKTSSEWDRIGLEYLAGEDSIREIADRHGISEAAIRKKAKAEGWVRAVRTPQPAHFCVLSRPEPASEAVVPIGPAEIPDRGRELLGRMLEELDTATSRPGELDYLIEVACAGDDDDKRSDALLKVMSLGGRAATLKTLATAYKTLNEAGAPLGKKEAAQQAAANAGGGRFRAMAPPGAPRSVN